MILLFGGTSETAGLATALAESGHSVLVSTATDAPLAIGTHPAIKRRCGRLDIVGIVALIAEHRIQVVVDASHPYATELHTTVVAAAQQGQVPCFRYQRLAAEIVATEEIYFVADHHEAATLAVKLARPVLLTTGSRQLAPYIDLFQKLQLPFYARVLPHPESEAACDLAGLPVSNRIVGRGPFSEEQNRELIQTKGIGTLITKDSGIRGGVPEKIAAAKKENCHVIVVQRPAEERDGRQRFVNIDELVASVNGLLSYGGGSQTA